LTSSSRLESAVARPLAAPRPADVDLGTGGLPAAVDATGVEAVREDWIVEDGWWTERPLRRRYLELALADGRNLVVFRDLETSRWFSQRA
jgi:hypothetical protein